MIQTKEKTINPVFWNYSWNNFKLFSKNSNEEISSIADLEIVKEVIIDILKEYKYQARSKKSKAFDSAIKDKYKQVEYCDRRREELTNCTDSLSNSKPCHSVAIESKSSTNQLELFCTDSLSNCNTCNSVDSESKSSTESGSIGTYKGGGSCRSQNEYFRYSYREGKKMKHIHIRGGNIREEIADSNAFLIQLEIDKNKTVKQIIHFINTQINI